VQETKIAGRVVLTPSAWKALKAAIGGDNGDLVVLRPH